MSKEFWEDWEWEIRNHSSLLKKYKNRWIAVVNKKVIVADEMEEIRELAVRTGQRKDIPYFFMEDGTHVY
jgi:hypothetical protein